MLAVTSRRIVIVAGLLLTTSCGGADPAGPADSAETRPPRAAPQPVDDATVRVPDERAPRVDLPWPDADATPGPVVGPSELDVERVEAEAEARAETEARIDRFLRDKVIRGWSTERTPHYLVVYDEDVSQKHIVRRVVKEIEVLREQLLEPLFPLARPTASMTILRVFESRKQYMAYGAPAGTAGYWSAYHEEAVVYQDRNDKRATLHAVSSVACVAYLHHALSGAKPHLWFSEGHGDYLAGHVFKAGRFRREPFGWRSETAREAKKRWKAGWERVRGGGGEAVDPEHLGLREWLGWSDSEFDRKNDWDVPGGTNYALAWSFVYFLRGSGDPAHEGVLDRYYTTLRDLAAAAADARETTASAGDATTTDLPERAEWTRLALAAALEGVDVAALERDWLAHDCRR